MQKLTNYINGEFVAPISGKYIDNINPSTQQVNNLIPDSDSRDVEKAVRAAQNAYKTWSKLGYKDRAVYLDRVATLLQEDRVFQQLASADTNDMGKPINFMQTMDVPGAIGQFTEYSKMIQCTSTPYYQMPDAVGFEHRNPIGLVGLISPWNFPVLLFCMKVSVAIVCGNCVICKPSEITPTTAYLVTRIFAKAGLPKGVVNVVHGYGDRAGEAISKHKAIRAISFTGGSVTGSRISGIAAPSSLYTMAQKDNNNKPQNNVEFVLLAEFDIDKGSTVRHQYPRRCPISENILADLMLPEGAHLREQDWTYFFLRESEKQTTIKKNKRRE
eukprot:224657_1